MAGLMWISIEKIKESSPEEIHKVIQTNYDTAIEYSERSRLLQEQVNMLADIISNGLARREAQQRYS